MGARGGAGVRRRPRTRPWRDPHAIYSEGLSFLGGSRWKKHGGVGPDSGNIFLSYT